MYELVKNRSHAEEVGVIYRAGSIKKDRAGLTKREHALDPDRTTCSELNAMRIR